MKREIKTNNNLHSQKREVTTLIPLGENKLRRTVSTCSPHVSITSPQLSAQELLDSVEVVFTPQEQVDINLTKCLRKLRCQN